MTLRFCALVLLVFGLGPVLHLWAEEGTAQEGEAECQSDQNAKVTTQADGSKKTECVPKWEKMDGDGKDKTPPPATDAAAADGGAAASSAPTAPASSAPAASPAGGAAAPSAPASPAAAPSGGTPAAAASNPAAPNSEPTRIGGDTPAAASPAPTSAANQPQGLGNKDPIREEQRALNAAVPAAAAAPAAPNSDKDNQADLVPQAQANYTKGATDALENKLDTTSTNQDYLRGASDAERALAQSNILDKPSLEPTPVSAPAPGATPTPTPAATGTPDGGAPKTLQEAIAKAKASLGKNFGSLVPGGSYSDNPYDLNVRRAIRTNNPGAINGDAKWVQQMPGFLGTTSDNVGNKTAIFQTPEEGVATWYTRVARQAGSGNTTFKDLIYSYSGRGREAAAAAYTETVSGWTGIRPNDVIDLSNDAQMTTIARGMWRYEAGVNSPLSDAQLAYGFQMARSGGLLQPVPTASNTGGGGVLTRSLGGGTSSVASYSPPSFLGGGGGYTGGGSSGGGSSGSGSAGGGAGQAVAAAPFTSPLAGSPVPFTPLGVTPTVPVAVAGTSGLDNLNLNCDNPTRGIEILLCPPKTAPTNITSCTGSGVTDAAKNSGLTSKGCS